MMKDCLKLFFIAVVGGLTAIILYPIIHEIGHGVSAIIFGVEVKELHVFPNAYVICDVSSTKEFGKIMIGLSGILLPFILSVFVHPKNFWGWYTCFIFRGVCILSFGFSLIAIALFIFGHEMGNEDIVQVLKIEPMYAGIYALVFIALMFIDLFFVAKSHPIQKCIAFFDL